MSWLVRAVQLANINRWPQEHLWRTAKWYAVFGKRCFSHPCWLSSWLKIHLHQAGWLETPCTHRALRFSALHLVYENMSGLSCQCLWSPLYTAHQWHLWWPNCPVLQQQQGGHKEPNPPALIPQTPDHILLKQSGLCLNPAAHWRQMSFNLDLTICMIFQTYKHSISNLTPLNTSWHWKILNSQCVPRCPCQFILLLMLMPTMICAWSTCLATELFTMVSCRLLKLLSEFSKESGPNTRHAARVHMKYLLRQSSCKALRQRVPLHALPCQKSGLASKLQKRPRNNVKHNWLSHVHSMPVSSWSEMQHSCRKLWLTSLQCCMHAVTVKKR